MIATRKRSRRSSTCFEFAARVHSKHNYVHFPSNLMADTLCNRLLLFIYNPFWLCPDVPSSKSAKLKLNISVLRSLGFIISFIINGLTRIILSNSSILYLLYYSSWYYSSYYVAVHFPYVLSIGAVFSIVSRFIHWYSSCWRGLRFRNPERRVSFNQITALWKRVMIFDTFMGGKNKDK